MGVRPTTEATELVIGLIGPIGCNRELVIKSIESLGKHHKYRSVRIKMSDVIRARVDVPDSCGDDHLRVSLLMDAGNELRKRSNDNAIIAKLAAETIATARKSEKDRRVIYIVDSIKHPEEVDAFRSIYGNGFYLVAIHSSEKDRDKYLESDCYISDPEKRKELIGRDQNENLGFGQSTRDAFHRADFFLSETGSIKKTKAWLERFLDLLFGHPFRPPTFNEFAMFMAYASSMRSADLSRQVGAVVTRGTDIVSTGANECPKAFGGTYWPSYDETSGLISDSDEGRDYKRGEDPNARERDSIIARLLQGIAGSAENTLRENINESGLRDITEYGRIVHAEMDSILACARLGISCAGATLYCTTFPCHNCAKHIVDAGISQVVYVEPYPKSKAIDLHADAIESNERKSNTRVVFRPFVGVGPRQFVNLFSMNLGAGEKLKRKAPGQNSNFVWTRGTSSPRVKLYPDAYLRIEEEAFEGANECVAKLGSLEVSRPG